MKIKVAIPARDTVMTGFAHALTCMVAASNTLPDMEILVSTLSGTLICDQRNSLAKSALAEGCDYILFLDSDMKFPADTLARLLDRQEAIVCANYTSRRAPAEPVAFAQLSTAQKLWTLEESKGLEECAACGLGVALIHMDVFRETPKPWFYIPYVPDADGHWGEDVWFCNQARKKGFPTFIDHDLSKEVGHIGLREYDYHDAILMKPQVERLWKAGMAKQRRAVA